MNHFDWYDYFTLAEELVNESEEASYRSAISRAYYAVYHIISERVSYRKPKQSRNSHWNLIKGLKNKSLSIQGLSLAETYNIANQLEFLKQHRQLSDYDSDCIITKHDAIKSCQKAKIILKKVHSRSSDYPTNTSKKKKKK